MRLELMEYDIHLCYRPGKLLDLADLMSRGHVEEGPTKREEIANELLEWSAKQEIEKLKDEEADQGIMKRRKPDDIIGETPMVEDRPPHLQSPAERAMQDVCTDPFNEYSNQQLEKHINLLVQGATVDMEDID